MFNLVKYELKGYYKDFIIILGVLILGNLFLFTKINEWQPQAVFAFSAMLTFAATIVVFIWNIRIFSRDMYEDTGYLLFTLPQKGYSILGAKLITTVIQALVVDLVAMSFNFIHASKMGNFNEIFTNLQGNVSMGFIVFISLGVLFEYLYFVLTIYFSISLSKVAIKNKKMGKIGGFLIFIAISVVQGKVMQLLTNIFPNTFNINVFTAQGQLNLYGVMGDSVSSWPINIAATIFIIILFLAMYWAISYIIENKLDF
jgi:hypothetical protein